MALVPLAGTRTNVDAITAADLVDNELVLDTTNRHLWVYDSANTRLISTQEYLWLFGGNGLYNTSDPLCAIGDISQGVNGETGYTMDGVMMITGWSFRRGDNDSAEFEIMSNSGTTEVTIATGTNFEGSAKHLSSALLVDGDRLWVRLGTGSANNADPRTFIVATRKIINL